MAGKQAMDALLAGFLEKGPAGCGCIVTKDGERIYENYFGVENINTGKATSADSVYRLFSSTKVIICTAAMKLFEEGKFLLNDPIYEYFPEWRNTQKVVYAPNGNYKVVPVEKPILVKHAFSMAMGIGYGGNDATHQKVAEVRQKLQEEKGNYTLREDIRAMSQVPIAFEPGTHFLYGFGHEMVAGLIEVASGMKVSEYLQKNIFDPLGMTSTGYRYFGDIASRMVTVGHRGEDGNLSAMENVMMDDRHQPDAVYEAGGAGLFSTVSDYSKFAACLANGGIAPGGEQIIGRKTIDLMRDNQFNADQLREFRGFYNDGYGYGLGVRTMMSRAMGNSNGTPGEFGWTGMLGTYTLIDPEENFSTTYMHQMLPNMEEYHHLRVRSVAYGMLR